MKGIPALCLLACNMVDSLLLTTRLLWAFDVVSLAAPDPHSYVNHGLVRGPGKISFELRFRDNDAMRLVEAEAAEAEERLKEWA